MQRSIQLLFLSALVTSFALTASAQTGTFAQSYEKFSGRVSFEDRRKAFSGSSYQRFDTTLLEPIIQQTWSTLRSKLTQIGDDFLRERDIGSGFRTSNNVILLAEKGTLYFTTTTSGFSMKYLLAGNTVTTTLRTPGPLPGFTDPRVTLSCDAVIKVDVFWTGSKMTIPPAQLIVGCRGPIGRNVTGVLAVGVIHLINTLGGPDFIGQWLAPINNGDFALNQQITRDLSKYTNGKLGENISISVSQANDAIDGSGKKTNRVIVAIEDKQKEYKIY